MCNVAPLEFWLSAMSEERAIYSSMSDVSLFLDEPALWFLRNFLRHRDPGGAKAWRGRAVETGVNYHLMMDWPVERCIAWASDEYWFFAEGEISEETTAEHGRIGAMVTNACDLFGNYGKPQVLQKRLEAIDAASGVRIVGYADMVYEDCVRDLKTKERMPSKHRAADLRQLTWYSDVLSRPAKLVYVTERQAREVPVTEPEMATARLEIGWALHAIARVKRDAERWREIALDYPPRDYTGWRWSDKTREMAREIYG